MALFLSLLPIYLFGNLHCMGMCGPLVFMIGRHRYRFYYFLGRLMSFMLAGGVAGAFGTILHFVLIQYHIPALASFIFGGVIFFSGIMTLCNRPSSHRSLFNWTSLLQQRLSRLMLQDNPLATFFFGFFTVALPCGQTVIVFSACALSGSVVVGLGNGLAFALLTSPSLYLAMQARKYFAGLQQYHHKIIGLSALFIGVIGGCRGAAELGFIEHMSVTLGDHEWLHLVLY